MKAILFCLLAATAVMFTLPATAAEDYEGFAPVYSIGSGSGDVIGAKVTDNKVTTCRCIKSQPEAVVVMSDKPHNWPEDEGVSWYSNGSADGADEVGWRS
jgi:hypothetical protein